MCLVEKGCHPILVRLAWHDAGTYDVVTKTGGPRAAMRFAKGESQHGANAGYASYLIANAYHLLIGICSTGDPCAQQTLSEGSRIQTLARVLLASPHNPLSCCHPNDEIQ